MINMRIQEYTKNHIKYTKNKIEPHEKDIYPKYISNI